MRLISAATFEGWSVHIYPLTSCNDSDDDDECSNNMHHMSDAAAAAPSLAIYVNTTLQLENVPRLAFSSNPVNNLTNTTLLCTGLVFVSLVTNMRVVHFYQQQQTSYLHVSALSCCSSFCRARQKGNCNAICTKLLFPSFTAAFAAGFPLYFGFCASIIGNFPFRFTEKKTTFHFNFNTPCCAAYRCGRERIETQEHGCFETNR